MSGFVDSLSGFRCQLDGLYARNLRRQNSEAPFQSLMTYVQQYSTLLSLFRKLPSRPKTFVSPFLKSKWHQMF